MIILELAGHIQREKWSIFSCLFIEQNNFLDMYFSVSDKFKDHCMCDLGFIKM